MAKKKIGKLNTKIKEKKENNWKIVGAFTLLGMAVGLLTGHTGAGTLIGIGLGIIVDTFIKRK